MTTSLYRLLAELWDVAPGLVEVAEEAEEATEDRRALWRERADRVFLRVLRAFQTVGVTESHLSGSTGYGYDDAGRAALEAVFTRVFDAEAALVRPQIVSGTHALSLCLRAAVEPGDGLVSGTGRPYDSLLPQVGELERSGVVYREVPLGPRGEVAPERVAGAVAEAARAARVALRPGGRPGGAPPRVGLFLQRSRGYELVPSRDLGLMERVIALARSAAEEEGVELVALVDNCYGEFVEDREPTAVGADLVGGSLIKNPGGGLAPTGGYVIGRGPLVERAAELLTAPGLGRHVGPTLGLGRLLLQGLFLAPRAVGAALAGATFAAAFLESLGLEVSPAWDEERTDIVQTVVLGSPEAVLAFARGVQAASPVDSTAVPVGAALPGYADAVVMAAGTFVQGSSIEVSLDAPLRSPYAAYLQGGLTEAHLKAAVVLGTAELERAGLLDVFAHHRPE